jgi:hypothetical protein
VTRSIVHNRPHLPADTPVPRELPDVLQFMQLLWAIVHALQKTSKRMSAELGVTGPQRLVLRVVGLSPGISAGRLAAVLRLHPSALTGILQRLLNQRCSGDRPIRATAAAQCST